MQIIINKVHENNDRMFKKMMILKNLLLGVSEGILILMCKDAQKVLIFKKNVHRNYLDSVSECWSESNLGQRATWASEKQIKSVW